MQVRSVAILLVCGACPAIILHGCKSKSQTPASGGSPPSTPPKPVGTGESSSGRQGSESDKPEGNAPINQSVQPAPHIQLVEPANAIELTEIIPFSQATEPIAEVQSLETPKTIKVVTLDEAKDMMSKQEKVEETMAGTINNNEKGFEIPPVK